MSRTVVVVQARLGSSRLPGKIFAECQGKTMLQHQVERIARARRFDSLIVATTIDPSDDPVELLCKRLNYSVIRGDVNDLLDRHVQAARVLSANHVVKIPSDCPLIDPGIIDKVIGFYLESNGNYDYVSNLHPASYPDGNDVEIMSIEALERAWREASKPMEREHCTPYIWDTGLFRCANVEWERGLDYSMSHRWTLDYKEDLDFICRVFDELYPDDPSFGIDSILRLLERKPEIAAINERYAGVNWYRNHLDELNTVSQDQTRKLETDN